MMPFGVSLAACEGRYVWYQYHVVGSWSWSWSCCGGERAMVAAAQSERAER